VRLAMQAMVSIVALSIRVFCMKTIRAAGEVKALPCLRKLWR
jgi:hypothetical protein